MTMKDGFYPALGTPTDGNGQLIYESYSKGIELVIEAGAQGVLCMGSMGKMASIRTSEYPKVVKSCVNTTSNRLPVFVGVMDCSVSRVLDRIEALDNIKIDGVVATAPFYSKVGRDDMINFFKMLSKKSKYPVYVYDLPPITQSPITSDILKSLVGTKSNIGGIKTANLELILDLCRNGWGNDAFSFFYSNLDLFDAAVISGVGKSLDGMFSCAPYNAKKMYENVEQGNSIMVSKHLRNIIKLRNLFLKGNVLPVFSYAMELLGCPGNYHFDYSSPVLNNELKEEVFSCMKAINEV